MTLVALVVGAGFLAGCGDGASRQRTPNVPTAPPKVNPAPFAATTPAPAPASWHLATTPAGDATLAYPPDWKPTSADPGTVSAATRDRRGFFHGYLNLTPKQGSEAPRGWAAFRVARNREEGSGDVRPVAAAEHLRFRAATGSCVVDDYSSRVAANRYRELACIVAGPTRTYVLIGAAPPREWAKFAPLIERSAAALVVR